MIYIYMIYDIYDIYIYTYDIYDIYIYIHLSLKVHQVNPPRSSTW